MKSCEEHKHEHRDLPCPWPDCPNGEGAGETIEVLRHTGAGRMTRAEGHFDKSPPPRRFQRVEWKCEKCGSNGWAWIEDGGEARLDRCPHRRPSTVVPRR
jgi:hypothetical protein